MIDSVDGSAASAARAWRMDRPHDRGRQVTAADLQAVTHPDAGNVAKNPPLSRVTYLRATPIRVGRSKAENPAMPASQSLGVMLGSAPVQPQALSTGTPDR